MLLLLLVYMTRLVRLDHLRTLLLLLLLRVVRLLLLKNLGFLGLVILRVVVNGKFFGLPAIRPAGRRARILHKCDAAKAAVFAAVGILHSAFYALNHIDTRNSITSNVIYAKQLEKVLRGAFLIELDPLAGFHRAVAGFHQFHRSVPVEGGHQRLRTVQDGFNKRVVFLGIAPAFFLRLFMP